MRFGKALVGSAPFVGGVLVAGWKEAEDRHAKAEQEAFRTHIEAILDRLASATERELPEATRHVLDDRRAYRELLRRAREIIDDVDPTVAPAYVLFAADMVADPASRGMLDFGAFLRALSAEDVPAFIAICNVAVEHGQFKPGNREALSGDEQLGVDRCIELLKRYDLARGMQLPGTQTGLGDHDPPWGARFDRGTAVALARYAGALVPGEHQG